MASIWLTRPDTLTREIAAWRCCPNGFLRLGDSHQAVFSAKPMYAGSPCWRRIYQLKGAFVDLARLGVFSRACLRA